MFSNPRISTVQWIAMATFAYIARDSAGQKIEGKKIRFTDGLLAIFYLFKYRFF